GGGLGGGEGLGGGRRGGGPGELEGGVAPFARIVGAISGPLFISITDALTRGGVGRYAQQRATDHGWRRVQVGDGAIRTRRWTRVEYDQLIAAEIFGPADRLELLGGEMVVKEPQHPPPATAIL